jgi:hypothetical protein
MYMYCLKTLAHATMSRETREGWPLLTVETEVNGDSKSTIEMDPFLVDSLGLSCQYKRFLFCIGCSIRPSTKYMYFPTVHYFKSFVPIAQQAGQAACLLVCDSFVIQITNPSSLLLILLHRAPYPALSKAGHQWLSELLAHLN